MRGMADRETWAKRVASWRASGLTAAEYSVGRGFAPSTLRFWASRLGRQRQVVRVVRAESAPIALQGAPLTEIELSVGGTRVQMRFALSREQVAGVLHVLADALTAAMGAGRVT